MNRNLSPVSALARRVLPDLPSLLILRALADLRAAKRAGHVDDMDCWIRPIGAGKCAVCLSGAVMLGMLGEVPHREIMPRHFRGKSIRKKIAALDFLRRGFVREALVELGLENPGIPIPNRYVCRHADDPEAWERDMFLLAMLLAERGL